MAVTEANIKQILNQFFVVAGPCSIEGHEQFLQTALAVKASGAHLLRGGIWKMRTQVDSFQGLGEKSLLIVQDVLAKTGMGLVSEITDPRQMEFLHPLVSVYQVGARNMFNYPLLQELGRQKKPVMLKRSFGALFHEWVKAANYIQREGNPDVILCERGIRTFENSTRFTFDLNSAILAKAETGLKVVVDPSHAVGINRFVTPVALAAVAAGLDGLIIEVHPDPEHAWSDGEQALTRDQFDHLMKKVARVHDAVI